MKKKIYLEILKTCNFIDDNIQIQVSFQLETFHQIVNDSRKTIKDRQTEYQFQRNS